MIAGGFDWFFYDFPQKSAVMITQHQNLEKNRNTSELKIRTDKHWFISSRQLIFGSHVFSHPIQTNVVKKIDNHPNIKMPNMSGINCFQPSFRMVGLISLIWFIIDHVGFMLVESHINSSTFCTRRMRRRPWPWRRKSWGALRRTLPLSRKWWYPIAGWFLFWKIRSRNGWELGVTLFQETSKWVDSSNIGGSSNKHMRNSPGKTGSK